LGNNDSIRIEDDLNFMGSGHITNVKDTINSAISLTAETNSEHLSRDLDGDINAAGNRIANVRGSLNILGIPTIPIYGRVDQDNTSVPISVRLIKIKLTKRRLLRSLLYLSLERIAYLLIR